MISVIIPTYNTPTALDLCIKSAIESQNNINNIVVVVDGTFEINKDILLKYKKYINPIILDKNVGTCKATNIGVYESQYDSILIVNDDNVFPKKWDIILSDIDISQSVISPNQIEPYNSIFSQFHIKDLGRDPKSFDLNSFLEYSDRISKNIIEDSGSTFPIFMNKINFLRCGGFDQDYPSPSGFVADWEFFMKCKMNGLKMQRIYSLHFYHFVSVSAKSPDQIEKSKIYEYNSHLYFKYKWGRLAQHNPIDNSKCLNAN
jgi:glycosyltransferase involved in cell wall biosynthesis